MKTTLALVVALIISLSAVSQNKSRMETTQFNVSMSCGKCKAIIEKNMPFEKGVKDLSVDLANKQVSITYDPTKTSKEELVKAFEKLKYTAKVIESPKPSESVKK